MDVESAPARLGTLRLRVFVPVWVVCGVLAALVLSAADRPNQAFYSRLIEHGVVAHAAVTRTAPNDHDSVSYTFAVRGRTYASSATSDPPNPPAARLRRGEHIHVVYDARDPGASCACDPRELASASQWWRRLGSGLFLGSIVALVLTLAIQRRTEPLRQARRAGRRL